MRVLIACEFSGVVRDAFAERGHDAWSCDLLPCERGGKHLQKDLLDEFGKWQIFHPTARSVSKPLEWDLIVAFPPCTHLCVSGARWFEAKQVEQRKAIFFFMAMIEAPASRVAVENPIGIMSTHFRKPDQIIQPWQFGHGETKATCLWLKNLPDLKPTNVVSGRQPRVHHASPGPDRWKERSRSLEGIAKAMAEQWGKSLTPKL